MNREKDNGNETRENSAVTGGDPNGASDGATAREVIANGIPEQPPPESPAGGDVPNTVTNPRSGAAPAWAALDARERDFASLQVGWSVFSADGEQIGEVSEVGLSWLVIPYGQGSERKMYVPEEYIESTTNHRVILNQPYGLLIDMKLDAPPTDFPDERVRVSGVEHDPRRGEPGSGMAVPEPPDILAQASTPAGADTGQGAQRHRP